MIVKEGYSVFFALFEGEEAETVKSELFFCGQ